MERLMQYVWQHRLWTPSLMKTTDGRPLNVLNPGWLNKDAGPDFANAQVNIDGKIWAGNIEIHIRASDWYRHRHHHDPAYDTVVLHVVAVDDQPVLRSNGETIPCLVMPCSPEFPQRYRDMVEKPGSELACAPELYDIPALHITDWLTALAFERLQQKADRIIALMKHHGGDWHTALYITLARALGFGTNAEPFERLATATPLHILMKHRTEPLQVESVLLGQAGLIPDSTDGESAVYADILRREYTYMCHKFDLTAPGYLGWKMARMRPQNFPHRRVAALAGLITSNAGIMHTLLAIETLAQARALFDVELCGFWASHVNFGPAVNERTRCRALSQGSVDTLVINVVVPLLYAFGMYTAKDILCERAMALMEEIPPEANSVVSRFTDAGIPCQNASDSQALIQLRKGYCESRRCLYCRLGHLLLAKKVLPKNLPRT